jgi:hypothetical protein
LDPDHRRRADETDRPNDLLALLHRRLRRVKLKIRELRRQGRDPGHWLTGFRPLARQLAEARADRRRKSGDDA